MPDAKVFLEKVYINNFLSFGDVELPLKPLTVLVGPNASGKSNVLEVLHLLHWLTVYGELPTITVVLDRFPTCKPMRSTLRFEAKVDQNRALYDLALEAKTSDSTVARDLQPNDQKSNPIQIDGEELSVNGVKVISTLDGKLALRDENDTNQTSFKSNLLALATAGDCGVRPVTNALAEFIKRWDFHDFEPKFMPSDLHRQTPEIIERKILGRYQKTIAFPSFGHPSFMSDILIHWHHNDTERFIRVSEALDASANFTLEERLIDGKNQICLLERRNNPMPLKTASGGTLRLIKYFILLNDPNPPPLIAIEEPEQNLHPGALADIANFLEQLAARTQVIITTHSSQLLDAINPENLSSDSLGILLLRNPLGNGTEIMNLQDIRSDRTALDGWIADFGIGSAIFESELLQDLME